MGLFLPPVADGRPDMPERERSSPTTMHEGSGIINTKKLDC
jgi:hypothetical protein